jgi:predicted amidohydrolase YtcJ
MTRGRLLIRNCTVGGRHCTIKVEDSRIISVEEGESAGPVEGASEVDARGGTVLPGLIDTHCHPFELGWVRRNVDLRGTSSITSLRLRLFAKAQRTAAGTWIFGRGWDHELFAEGRLPTREDIDEVTPRNPAVLVRVCGHIALLNSSAIEALGLESAAGEEFQRDISGRLTGIVKETALDRVFSSIPREGDASAEEDLIAAEYEAARNGLTELHCIVSPDDYRNEIEALCRLSSEGRSILRLRVYVPPNSLNYISENRIMEKLNGQAVSLNGVKIFADGSLGARTAALREPYSDDRTTSGILRYTDEQMKEIVEKVDRMGYQAIVHAIGDRAVEQAVEAIGHVAGNRNSRRHRIEHASLAPKDLRAKMKKHGICVTIQPQFVISDSWARKRLGEERLRDLYPFRSMLMEGIIASGSSDAPVETVSPLIGMWAAMVRADYSPDERLDLKEAIKLYTENAAYNGMDESFLGKVREGMAADLTVLDSEVEGMHPAIFRKVGVAATVVAGEIVHSYEGSQ